MVTSISEIPETTSQIIVTDEQHRLISRLHELTGQDELNICVEFDWSIKFNKSDIESFTDDFELQNTLINFANYIRQLNN